MANADIGPDSRPVASAIGVSKSFGKHRVLYQLNLSVEAGTAVGLLGANGAGKTTLLKLLLGLIRPDEGEATVMGESASALSAGVRGRIAYVPQAPGQFAWLNGRAMLAYLSAFYPRFDWEYTNSLIERWKVSMRTPISVLSPGQQQRLSIVRALATRPDLLVFDEPIASLDPATRIAVIDELVSERQQRSITIVFSSHITGDLERLCSHMAVLSGGVIAAFDTVDAFGELACMTLEGEEVALATVFTSQARAIRKPRDGQRVLVIDRDVAALLAANLPAGVTATVASPGLESTLAEWMR